MQKTKVIMILDKSGSMASTANQAVMNYNEQIQQFKENSKEQEIKACLITFNGDVYEHFWAKDAAELEEAEQNSFYANGGTALWDAMGYAIKKMRDSDDGESSYLVIVISDGAENSSKKYNQNSIKELITECKATNRWTFSYMGCSLEYVEKIAQETGIPLGNCAAWSNKTAGQAFYGYSSMNRNSRMYFDARSRGECSTESLCSADGAIADYSCENTNNAPVDNSAFIGTNWVNPSVDMTSAVDATKSKKRSIQSFNNAVYSPSNIVSNGVFANSSKVVL